MFEDEVAGDDISTPLFSSSITVSGCHIVVSLDARSPFVIVFWLWLECMCTATALSARNGSEGVSSGVVSVDGERSEEAERKVDSEVAEVAEDADGSPSCATL